MLERFIDQTSFTSQEDFIKHFKIKVPENFNFGYDVVDAWAAERPDKTLFFGQTIKEIIFSILMPI